MASIKQAPAALDITGVSGSPLSVTLNVTATDDVGDLIPWGNLTGWTFNAEHAPSVSSPESGVLVLAWDTDATALIAATGEQYWLGVTVSGNGPLAVLAGKLAANPPSEPGTGTSSTVPLSVQVGTATVALSIALAGGGGVTQLLAGAGVDLDPSDGFGVVTITVPGGAGLTLNPTAVMTAPYAAQGFDLAKFDTTAGSITQPLPHAPGDQILFAAKIVRGSNTLVLTCQGSDVLNIAGGPTSDTLRLTNELVLMQYQETGAIWNIVGDDLPLGQLDLRYDAAGAAAAALATTEAFATSAVGVETTRAEAAEATKASTSALSVEVSRAEAAEALLASASALTAEIARAEAAEATKASSSALSAETARAEAAEAVLIPLADVTTKGDLLVAASSAVVARLPVGSDGQVLTARAAATDGLDWETLPVDALFGNGADGNVTISTTVTLTRDMFYQNLTINNGGTLVPAGYRVWVRGTLTINSGGAINNNGPAGTNPSGAASVGATLGGSNDGGNGTTGAGGAGNSISGAATPVGGTAGAGGAGSNGGGGAAGVISAAGTTSYGNVANAFPFCFFGAGIANAGSVILRAGACGGAGGGNGSNTGGGGGAGGTATLINANTIVNNGTISANGGAGAAGGLNNCGGGGGGGGGPVIINTASLTGSGSVTSTGGAAGTAGGGSGLIGTAGGAGPVITNTWGA